LNQWISASKAIGFLDLQLLSPPTIDSRYQFLAAEIAQRKNPQGTAPLHRSNKLLREIHSSRDLVTARASL
jgi:hypothetical protein